MSDTEEPSKKRSITQTQDEIEIDLTQSAPLSKKQKRLLRKGKLDLDKLEAKQKKEALKLSQAGSNTKGDDSGDKDSSEAVKSAKPPKYGVWIGNLSFDTEKDDLIRFITNKTFENKEYTEDLPEDELVQINEKDFIRINLPTLGKDTKKIKGFAYIDFPTKNHQLSVIKLSESNLNGRNLLIKNSESFEGRPAKDDVSSLSKNPPSRILFVGNLSFDTTNELLTQQFQHCGEIIKIRMATFEDTGKCKGFAFLDFRDEEGPTKALKDKSCRKLLNRPLRLEFGEDRSKRAPKPRNSNRDEESSNDVDDQTHEPVRYSKHHDHSTDQQQESVSEKPIRDRSNVKKPSVKRRFDKPESREKSSVALAKAQRASAAIVKSTGKKITF